MIALLGLLMWDEASTFQIYLLNIYGIRGRISHFGAHFECRARAYCHYLETQKTMANDLLSVAIVRQHCSNFHCVERTVSGHNSGRITVKRSLGCLF